MIAVMGGDITNPSLVTGRAMLDEALALYREIGDKGGEGNILWALGSFTYFTADAAAAESWYRRSLELHRQAENRTMEAWSLHMLALSQAGQRLYADAGETAHHALRHFHEFGDVSGIILVLDDLAIVAIGIGEVERAGRLWGAARHLQESTGTALADYIQRTDSLFGVPTPKDFLASDVLEPLAAQGAALSLDEAVAYALETTSGVPPAPDAHAEVA
jgi:hypothetical protein